MNPRFRFTVGSEPDYEDLVGDLYFDEHIVCVLTQEAGFEAMQVELHSPPEGGAWTFPLADFESALNALKQRMWELRRTDTPPIPWRAYHPISGDRFIVIASRGEVGRVLANQPRCPVAALLASHDVEIDPVDFELAVRSLLDAGCEYFVCFGPASEALHDRIDELIIDRAPPSGGTIMTTWHDDETAAEVVEFFFNVAGAKQGSLLIAVLEPSDAELANLLTQQAPDLR